MGISINHNARGVGSAGPLAKAQKGLQKTLAKLSSGLRINQAADDAAGLAIATRFSSQIRGLNQAMRNSNDGISVVQTAEGALNESTNIAQRMRELSIQASNGTLNDQDRKAIQSEMDQLNDELGRIAGTTTFNGKKILDGSLSGLTVQTGPNAGDRTTIPFGDARPTSLGRGATVSGGGIDASGIDAGELTINGVDIRASLATDDPHSTTANEGSAIAVAAAINASSDETGVEATVEAAEVSGAEAGGGTLDENNQLIINGETISGVDVQANDADDALVDGINAVSEQTGVTASLNADGGIDLTAADGRNIEVQTTGNAAAISGISAGVTTGTVTLSSRESIVVEGADPADAGLAAGTTSPSVDESLSTVDVTTQPGAENAIDTIDRALSDLVSQRASLGAAHNRLESTVSNLGNVAENLSAARSRIMDADYAKQSSERVLGMIRERAGIAVLAQAQASNQVALALLNG